MPTVSMKVNGQLVSHIVEENTLLVTYLRECLGLTGTHIGCDTSQCGACVIHVNGVSTKSCTMLAVQVDGREITTIEGIAEDDELHPMQRAFHKNHGLQCGFCTPGMIMSAIEMIEENRDITELEIRQGLEGNICRCTGYHNIVKAIAAAARSQ
jgi:carbon-monoxide dehydrogenase small subunit